MSTTTDMCYNNFVISVIDRVVGTAGRKFHGLLPILIIKGNTQFQLEF